MPLKHKHPWSILLVSMLAASQTVMATPDEDARAAYDRGEYDTAYKIWSDLADQNDGRAQYALGVMYATGSGREKDPAKAVEWFGKAAGNGHLKAMYNLGIAYWTGQGILEDRAEATHWWRMAAERGDVVSQYNLGVAYYNGLGVDQDLVEAARWIRSAAEQDYETAVELLPTLEAKIRDASPEPTANVASETGQAGEAPAAAEDNAPSRVASSDTAPSGAPASEETISLPFRTGFIKTQDAKVYAINNSQMPVIDNLGEGTPVKIIDSRGDWVEIEAPDGFKLWVFGRFVSGDGEGATISGTGVRARSLPSTAENSASPGKFKENDRVSVIRSEGDWKYVQAPSHLRAWLRADDITELDKATKAWADRWTEAGGKL